MRIGIPALLYNIEDALDICDKNKQIKHLEIGIDNLEECDMLKKYKSRINELDLSIGIHLPMELNTCENIKYISECWVLFINKINDKLKEFDVRYFNMHLGYVITNRLQKNRNKYLDKSVEFLQNVILSTNESISIENTYSNNGDFSNIGNQVEDFEYIFNRIKNNNLLFCYDTGHYLINKSNYIEKLSENIKIVHLSDNDGVYDIHTGIGRGILRNNHIKDILNIELDYLVLEVDYKYIAESINNINFILKEV